MRDAEQAAEEDKMNNKQREMIFELFTGTLISQEILIQTLHRSGALKKKDVMDGLDFFIDYFEKKNPEQRITLPMKYLRKNLEKYFPGCDHMKKISSRPGHPAWLKGVIQGGLIKKENKERMD
jgi:hypothetical protein